ncbi:MAG: diphosphomevalonate decarboxylase, partial [Myxococcota bacterium]
MITKRDVVRVILQGRPKQPRTAVAQAFAPANIALCKYWGKRDTELNLPVTSSLSLSLGDRGTHVKLRVVGRNEGKEDRGDVITIEPRADGSGNDVLRHSAACEESPHAAQPPLCHPESVRNNSEGQTKDPLTDRHAGGSFAPALPDDRLESPHTKSSGPFEAFLDLFRADSSLRFHVSIRNSIPIAAGLASSASMFGALVKALNTLFAWNLPARDLSILARLGSGSACRSLHEGFVQWHAGSAREGMDSYAEPLRATWPDLRLGLVIVSETPKTVGSREAMHRTVTTSALYRVWPAQVKKDLPTLRRAIHAHDFTTLGQTAESNALAMHATMLGARPPMLYWLPQSVGIMHQVWQARADGVPVYWTMDAGPNVKLLFQRQH